MSKQETPDIDTQKFLELMNLPQDAEYTITELSDGVHIEVGKLNVEKLIKKALTL